MICSNVLLHCFTFTIKSIIKWGKKFTDLMSRKLLNILWLQGSTYVLPTLVFLFYFYLFRVVGEFINLGLCWCETPL
jgi:hypothetical protein